MDISEKAQIIATGNEKSIGIWSLKNLSKVLDLVPIQNEV